MAALDFPGSPTNGQIYNANGLSYSWDSDKNAWVNRGVPGLPGSSSTDNILRYNGTQWANVTGISIDSNGDFTGTSITLTGNLAVQGTTTTLETATLNVEDKNITLNYSTGDATASANGAGITIQDAVNSTTDATILWDTVTDNFDFSHGIDVTGNIVVSGTVDGRDLASDGSKLDGIEAGATADQTLGDLGITATAAELNVLDNIPATLTSTELGYVDGVTSSIQTQLNAKQASLTFGIADGNAVDIDDLDAADDDYAKFTANGLEGRSYSEVKTDLSLNNVENTALSTWPGTTNITTLGTIGTGTWQATAIADDYISSAATWNAKQDALTFGIANTNSVVINSASVVDNDYAKFTASGLEGRSASEVKTDLSLNNVENTALSTWPGTTNITTLGTITSGTWNAGTVTTTGLTVNGNATLTGTITDASGAGLIKVFNRAGTQLT